MADPRGQQARREGGLQLFGVLVQLGRKVGQQPDDLLGGEERSRFPSNFVVTASR